MIRESKTSLVGEVLPNVQLHFTGHRRLARRLRHLSGDEEISP